MSVFEVPQNPAEKINPYVDAIIDAVRDAYAGKMWSTDPNRKAPNPKGYWSLDEAPLRDADAPEMSPAQSEGFALDILLELRARFEPREEETFILQNGAEKAEYTVWHADMGGTVYFEYKKLLLGSADKFPHTLWIGNHWPDSLVRHHLIEGAERRHAAGKKLGEAASNQPSLEKEAPARKTTLNQKAKGFLRKLFFPDGGSPGARF